MTFGLICVKHLQINIIVNWISWTFKLLGLYITLLGFSTFPFMLSHFCAFFRLFTTTSSGIFNIYFFPVVEGEDTWFWCVRAPLNCVAAVLQIYCVLSFYEIDFIVKFYFSSETSWGSTDFNFNTQKLFEASIRGGQHRKMMINNQDNFWELFRQLFHFPRRNERVLGCGYLRCLQITMDGWMDEDSKSC